MMASKGDDALAVLALLLTLNKRVRKKREKWCKDWILKRKSYSHVNLLNELKFEPKDFQNYLRMDEKTYLKLLSLVSPFIIKKDTVMRKSISPHQRLTATLRFLATGRSYEDLKYSTIISPQALGKIIPETCDALYKVLRKQYLKFPKCQEDWKEIADLFEARWNFPHCLGAIDGKHIDIIPPAGSGSEFFNYKGRHSLVLLGIANAKYQFILADFGTNGRISDGGVLQNTKFFEMLTKGDLRIPTEEYVKGNGRNLPYVFVADDAFALRSDMMKPFRQADLNSNEKKIFNYRLSRARRIIENTFGILAARFRIFHTQINVEPENIIKIVMAAVVLHNFLIENSPKSYAPKQCVQEENADGTVINYGYNTQNSSMENLEQRNPGNINDTAKNVRENFMYYFNHEGSVPWQNNYNN
ncbi:unnamed protein product [Acanthoscelides obtectus]|uniref:DDE Tnp4 domain-containing protein n=1 Tax=Acanthoscelides obtectus TaxID=200917 RepID=A0A9P0MB17_ACAOB|nr:unnamed protein product [Acanthoscelides obtectus]CAK1640885.1 Putative nuclease HARBI1 [Acanthoscelides obtectus]